MLDETLDTWLHRALLFERFGPLPVLVREQLPVDTYADIRRRRRVLLGEDELGGADS